MNRKLLRPLIKINISKHMAIKESTLPAAKGDARITRLTPNIARSTLMFSAPSIGFVIITSRTARSGVRVDQTQRRSSSRS